MHKCPVLFLIFNRPETTFEVFAAIRQYQPQKLYIGADGPRKNNISDTERCNAVRKITELIDWQCEVHRLFQSENLGCRYAPSTAITWFFEQEEKGIILEDDCLPSPDFFRFCENMLERYANDEQVMHIGGTNFQDGIKRGNGDYYFSDIPHIWGWATWRRAWQYYDVEMTDFPNYLASGKNALRIPFSSYYRWRTLVFFRETWKKSKWFVTWDCQWHYTLAKRNAKAIIPNYNMISNIGGTGTHKVDTLLCKKEFQILPEKILPPDNSNIDPEAELYTYRKCIKGSWKDKIKFCFYLLLGGDKK